MSEDYQLLWFFDWQHLQQDSVNQTEDGGVRTDPQSQRQDDDGREARILTKLTKGETKVVVHRLQVCDFRSLVLVRFSLATFHQPLATALFAPKGYHRIDARRPPRRQVAGQQGHAHQKQ